MQKLSDFFKKQWQNLLFFVIITLLIIPQTRFPIQVQLQRVLSFAPTASEEITSPVNLQGWTLKSIDKTLTPESIDKPKLINFWATWCPPCVAEMPSLQKLYADYSEEVEFIFVSNEDLEKTSNFSKNKNYNMPFYKSVKNQPEELDGKQLPTTYLIDAEGNILVKHVGSADWNAKSFRKTLDDLLK